MSSGRPAEQAEEVLNERQARRVENINDAVFKDVWQAVQNLPFGTVLLTVHQSRIVQMEVTEKKRFDSIWMEKGGGI